MINTDILKKKILEKDPVKVYGETDRIIIVSSDKKYAIRGVNIQDVISLELPDSYVEDKEVFFYSEETKESYSMIEEHRGFGNNIQETILSKFELEDLEFLEVEENFTLVHIKGENKSLRVNTGYGEFSEEEVIHDLNKFYLENVDIDTYFFKPYLNNFHIIAKHDSKAVSIEEIIEKPSILFKAMDSYEILNINSRYETIVAFNNYLTMLKKESPNIIGILINNLRELVVKGRRFPITMGVKMLLSDDKFYTPEQSNKFHLSNKLEGYITIGEQKVPVKRYVNTLFKSMAPALIRDFRTGEPIKNSNTFNGESISDCSLSVGAKPQMRVGSFLEPRGDHVISFDTMNSILNHLLSVADPIKSNRYRDEGYCRIAYSVPNYGRYRVTINQQRGTPSLSARRLPDEFIPFEAFGIPAKFEESLLTSKSGLILVAGKPNSGKSSLIASIINHRSIIKNEKILTVEDPIEFLFRHNGGLVNQIELGSDMYTPEAIRTMAVTSDPDVIYLTEIRNYQELDIAINMALTGNLVYASTHAGSVYETLNRCIDFIPSEIKESKKNKFISALRMIFYQQLVPRKGGGRVPAQEILNFNSSLKNSLKDNLQENSIRQTLRRPMLLNKEFDTDLYNLWKTYDLITEETFNNYKNSNNESSSYNVYSEHFLLPKERRYIWKE